MVWILASECCSQRQTLQHSASSSGNPSSVENLPSCSPTFTTLNQRKNRSLSQEGMRTRIVVRRGAFSLRMDSISSGLIITHVRQKALTHMMALFMQGSAIRARERWGRRGDSTQGTNVLFYYRWCWAQPGFKHRRGLQASELGQVTSFLCLSN